MQWQCTDTLLTGPSPINKGAGGAGELKLITPAQRISESKERLENKPAWRAHFWNEGGLTQLFLTLA